MTSLYLNKAFLLFLIKAGKYCVDTENEIAIQRQQVVMFIHIPFMNTDILPLGVLKVYFDVQRRGEMKGCILYWVMCSVSEDGHASTCSATICTAFYRITCIIIQGPLLFTIYGNDLI